MSHRQGARAEPPFSVRPTMSQRSSFSLGGVEAELRDACEVELRGLLGDSRYEAEYSDGTVLTVDDAVAVALASIPVG